jgi:hypothetical protein
VRPQARSRAQAKARVTTASLRFIEKSRYTERLKDAEVVASIGGKGNSYDNAAAWGHLPLAGEAFNWTFKSELIRNRHILAENGHWRSIDDVEVTVAEWVDLVQHHPAARQPERRSTHRVRDQLLR